MNFNLSRYGKVLVFGLLINLFPGCSVTTPDNTTKGVTEENYIELQTEADFNKLIAEKDVVLAKFYATWCPPCRQLAPVVHEVAKEMPAVTFISIDTDKFRALVAKYGLSSIPAMMIFKGGKKVFGPEFGVRSKDEIKGWLNRYL